MRKIIAIFGCIVLSVFSLNAQSLDSINNSHSSHVTSLQVLPRYKMYKTESMYILLKLDTATGRIWMVQYGMNKKPQRAVVVLNDVSLIENTETLRAGRFELYPTSNSFTFILLDTEFGDTYQVQWYSDTDKTFVVPIF